jgi:hypothetical protein
MNDLFSQVEIENVAGEELLAFSITASGAEPAPVEFFGSVGRRVEDQDGKPVHCYDAAPSGLKHLDLGEAPDYTLRPVVRLLPGQVVRYPFSLFGWLNLDRPLRPGTFRVRAVFTYRELPDATEREALSEPIVVEITQRDIDEWRASEESHLARPFKP